MNWAKTEGADDMLRILRGKGISYDTIASEINAAYGTRITRNACIGRALRIGLAMPERARKAQQKRGGRRAIPAQSRKTSPLAAFLAHKATLPHLPETPADDVARVSLIDLEPHHCRYPVGDPRQTGFGFCGDHHVPGAPYCERHAIRCAAPNPVRQIRHIEWAAKAVGHGTSVACVPKEFVTA